MNDRVDLHIHSSKSSDGDFTPFHLLHLAKECGYRAISIADHDTVDAYPGALEASRKVGVELIPSVELTTVHDGREFHLLLPFVAWDGPALKKILDRISRARVEEAKARIAKLQALGFDISWEEVRRRSRGLPPLGIVIAEVLIEKGRQVRTPALQAYWSGDNSFLAPYRFYRDYFLEGKPAWVPKQTVKLVDVLDTVAGNGAVPVLAHPGADFERARRDDIAALRDRGLVGLEVFSPYHDRRLVEEYRAIADEFGLVATAGSDFHGRVKPHVTFGSLKEGTYRMVDELRKRRQR